MTGDGNASRSLGVASQLQSGAPSTVILTGAYGALVLEPVRHRLERLSGRPLRILTVPNGYFGGNVGVSGLMVGEDIRTALESDHEPAGSYLIPDVTLSGDRFLDDTTVREVAAGVAAPLLVVPTSVAGIVAGASRWPLPAAQLGPQLALPFAFLLLERI